MPYIIDKDVAIDYLGEDITTVKLLLDIGFDDMFISMVTYMEVLDGILTSPTLLTAQAKFDAFINQVTPLNFTEPIAQRCAIMRATLRLQGKRIRPRALDLITAATALEHNLTLVTRNRADYQDIPGLALL